MAAFRVGHRGVNCRVRLSMIRRGKCLFVRVTCAIRLVGTGGSLRMEGAIRQWCINAVSKFVVRYRSWTLFVLIPGWLARRWLIMRTSVTLCQYTASVVNCSP